MKITEWIFLFFLERGAHLFARKNAEVVLVNSTVYPFRIKSKTLICVYCCEEYEFPDLFRQHIDEDHDKFNVTTAFGHLRKTKEYLKVDCTDLKCRLCLEPMNNIKDVAKHLVEKHINMDTKRINLNFDIGLQPYRLERDKWCCFLCNENLPSLVKLCRHTTSHYTKYTCESCGRSYLTTETLRHHIRTAHSSKHICRKCWKEFTSAQERREHIKSSKRCWQFCCIHCGERFISWEQKYQHLVDLHGQKKTTYSCPDCSKTYESRSHFYSHYKIEHTNDSFVCSGCGMKFSTKRRLEDHRIVHTGQKDFKCNVCSKSFSRKKSLVQHMWIHSDAKRFACFFCDKRFAQKFALKGHIKSNHPNMKTPFQLD